jgi:DNA repair exonuclease SbcCD ATPase subunit
MDIAAILSGVNVIGLAVFGFLVKSLRDRIENLTLLAKEQKETLDAVRTRATELDQLRKDYRQGLEDFQDLGKKLEDRRSQLVTELEQANKAKDDELARMKTLQLEELELKKRSLERIPEIEQRLSETVAELGRQMSLLSDRSSDAGAITASLDQYKSHFYPPGAFAPDTVAFFLENRVDLVRRLARHTKHTQHDKSDKPKKETEDK